MEEEVMQGYGSPGDLLSAPAGDAELAQMGEPMDGQDGAGEAEALIAEGVQAFMQTQDPEIAVQVVMMLAETMGLAAGAGQGATPAPPAGAPMAKNGGKFGFFTNPNRAGAFMKFVTSK